MDRQEINFNGLYHHSHHNLQKYANYEEPQKFDEFKNIIGISSTNSASQYNTKPFSGSKFKKILYMATTNNVYKCICL